MQKLNDLPSLLAENKFILMEAAVGEALRRRAGLSLHPELGALSCIYDQAGRKAMSRLYSMFIEIAEQGRAPLLITAPTWRSNHERLSKTGFPLRANQEAVCFIQLLKQDSAGKKNPPILLGGLLGPKNDAYRPDQGLEAKEAEDFHLWQAEELALSGVEYLMAATMPALEEAAGIAQAMTKTHVPSIVSFVLNRQGLLLDGHSLEQAIDRIDSSCSPKPLGYMVNCSYPSFLHPENEPKHVLDRLIGYQANASSLEHQALDNAEKMHMDDVQDWGKGMVRLHHRYGLKILGGCCGTGEEHLRYLVEHISVCQQ